MEIHSVSKSRYYGARCGDLKRLKVHIYMGYKQNQGGLLSCTMYNVSEQPAVGAVDMVISAYRYQSFPLFLLNLFPIIECLQYLPIHL